MTIGVEVRCGSALLPEGIVEDVRLRLERGRIRSVERAAGPLSAGEVSLDGLVLPGMPNLHSHAFQRALVGRTEHRREGSQDSFWTWREEMYRVAERLDAPALRAVAGLLYVEMLEAGYTAVGEFHYLHHRPGGERGEDLVEFARAILEAAAEVGIRLTLLPVAYFKGGFGTPPSFRQRRFTHADVEDFLASLEEMRRASTSTSARLGVAPHSLRAVPVEALTDVLVGARSILGASCPVHIHVAEQPAEVEACVEATGQRPVALLLERFDVGPRWCLVHATHADARERSDLAASGAVLGICPSTEANLGDGLFPFDDFLRAGGVFGVGSDSQVSVDPAEELRHLDYQSRLRHLRRGVLALDGTPPRPGLTLWGRAHAGGARALGEEHCGLAPGGVADLVELDLEHPRLVGLEPAAALDALLLGSAPGAVRRVWVAGRPVVEASRHVGRDVAERRFREASRAWASAT